MEGWTLYLKQVELENFKSFGKKKKIPFLKGFTVITGPNGSGKSNIGDAILFVLGPRSGKAIRAGKLTNLIYNGGKTKKAARFTKVSLVFDNIDRIIPLDVDEVTFTRHVKLSPSDPENYLSYFYVNGRKSSLNEFADLLSHAHISAEGYNLVKQGDVTRIVEMGNLERRRVLDDVSGVTRYDDDIKKAEEQKKGLEENLDRIGIIIDEIKRQIKMLEKERGAALKYKELKDTYDLAKAQSAHKRKDMVQREIISIEEQIEGYHKKEQELEDKKKEMQIKLEELGEALKEIEEKIAQEGGDEARELKVKIDGLRIEIARAKDKIISSKDMRKSLKGEKAKLTRDLTKLNKELEEFTEKKANIDGELEGKKEALSKVEVEHDKEQETVGKSDSEALSIQERIQDINTKIQEAEDGFRATKIEEDRTSEKVERLRQELAELEGSANTVRFEIKDADFQLKEMSKAAKESGKSLKSLSEELEAKKEEEQKLYKEAQEMEAAITRLNREYNRLKAEAAAAESVQKGYNMAVTGILEARDTGKLKGIHGTIAELAQVDGKFETAMSVAAGARMQSIVVDDDECASKAIEYLKKKKIGRATFLPLNKMSEGRPRGKALMAQRSGKSLGFALELIDFKPQYKAAFWYVLGDTVVMEDLKAAREIMGGIRIVTLEGELLEAAGAMIGGKLRTQKLKFGAPSKSEIEKVGKELRSAIEHADILEGKLQEIKNTILELDTQIREHGGVEGPSTIKLEDLKSKRAEYKKKLATVENNLNEKTQELETAEKMLEKMAEELNVTEKSIEDLKGEREEESKKLIKATPQEYARKIKKLQNRIHTLTTEVSKLESSSETMAAQIKIHMERQEELTVGLEDIESQLKDHKEGIKKNQKKEKEYSNELEALLIVESNMNKQMRALAERRDKIYKDKTDCEAAIDKIATKMETNRDFVIGLRAKVKNAEDRLAEVEVELQEYKVELDLSEKLPSLERLKETISSCERRMRNLEPINMKAIDDYDEQQTRLDELITEVKHLKDQRRTLKSVVKELDKKKTIEFMKVFEGINENFKKIFAELSYGGEAELLLEYPESPFDGGLIIKARPRGKKVLRLESLSGGEKSLTALALIFSIQHYEPSPFYLLDEVDMFLDAINAERVARMVKKNSRQAQFVMVSLRKVTLKEADAIYGVTMRADSISDVVGNVSLHDIELEIPQLAEDECTPPQDEMDPLAESENHDPEKLQIVGDDAEITQ
jgi:chromosome segregation protein